MSDVGMMPEQQVLVIPTNGEIYITNIGDKDGRCLEELQALVGGYIEQVIIHQYDDDMIGIYVHEEGRLLGLEHNAMAKKMLNVDVVGNVVLYRYNDDKEIYGFLPGVDDIYLKYATNYG